MKEDKSLVKNANLAFFQTEKGKHNVHNVNQVIIQIKLVLLNVINVLQVLILLLVMNALHVLLASIHQIMHQLIALNVLLRNLMTNMPN